MKARNILLALSMIVVVCSVRCPLQQNKAIGRQQKFQKSDVIEYFEMGVIFGTLECRKNPHETDINKIIISAKRSYVDFLNSELGSVDSTKKSLKTKIRKIR